VGRHRPDSQREHRRGHRVADPAAQTIRASTATSSSPPNPSTFADTTDHRDTGTGDHAVVKVAFTPKPAQR
jgi:hypothetical protein